MLFCFLFFFSSCISSLTVGIGGGVVGGMELSLFFGKGLECFCTSLDFCCDDVKLWGFCSVTAVTPGISCRIDILLIFGTPWEVRIRIERISYVEPRPCEKSCVRRVKVYGPQWSKSFLREP